MFPLLFVFNFKKVLPDCTWPWFRPPAKVSYEKGFSIFFVTPPHSRIRPAGSLHFVRTALTFKSLIKIGGASFSVTGIIIFKKNILNTAHTIVNFRLSYLQAYFTLNIFWSLFGFFVINAFRNKIFISN